MPLTPGAEFRVNTTTAGNQTQPEVAQLTNGGYAAIWLSGADVIVQMLDPQGALVGPEKSLGATNTTFEQPTIAALPAGGFVVTYSAADGGHVVRHDAAGNRVGETVLPGAHELVAAGLPGGGYALAWSESGANSSKIVTQAYDVAGAARGPATTALSATTFTGSDHATYGGVVQDPSITALPGGGYAIAYEIFTRAGGGTGLGATHGTFTTIQAATYTADGQLVRSVAVQSNPPPVEGTSIHYVDPTITAAGGSIVVTSTFSDFTPNHTSVDSRIQADRLDANLSNKVTTVVGQGADADVQATADGGFVVSYTAAGVNDVVAQPFDGAGQTVGAPFTVNAYTAGVQAAQAMAPAAGGGFLEVWRSDGQDGSQGGIYGRIFTPEAAPSPGGPEAFNTAMNNILRPGAASPTQQQYMAGQLTWDAAMQGLVTEARSTTSVATLAYEFFTGKTPSAAGLDYLVSPMGPNPNNLNSAYYQSFNMENRYINFAVNLGKTGEGASAFAAAYGGLSLFDATRTAYASIFGEAPSDAKLHALLDAGVGDGLTRADYFNAYGQDGVNGVGTKAAMVGWLLAEAEKADVGVYAKVNDAYLMDLTDGAPYNIDIVGAYNRPDYVYHPG